MIKSLQNRAALLLRIVAMSLLMLPLCSQADTVFKIATISPDGSAWMRQMRAAAKTIEARTEKRVSFKFYPGGVMGNDKAVQRKIRIGQLQGGAFPGGSMVSAYPDSQIYNLPLLFRSYEEIDYVRKSLDAEIMAGYEKGGFVTFGLAEGGFAYLMTNNRAVATPEALKQQKVWVPNDDPASAKALSTFDVSPIPLAVPDVLASLQTGLIDTVAASPIVTIALQWHTQVKHMTDLPLLYFYATLAIDKKAFGKLSPADQATVREVLVDTFRQIDAQNRKDNVAAFDAMKKQGITVTVPTAQERELWLKKSENAVKSYVDSGYISQAAYDRVMQLLNEYRKQHPAS
jgi:TRAP-type C4-dicarboxylate transport system substrate-binding protein